MNQPNFNIEDPAFKEMIDRLVDEKVDAKLGGMQKQLADIRSQLVKSTDGRPEAVSLLVFSGDFDKLMSAFIIASGSIAMGMEVYMYFTFWGLTALKKKNTFAGKSIPEKMLGVMLPTGPKQTGTSKMNMMGIGPAFFKTLMKQHNVESLPDLISLSREMGAKLVACQMSMGIMGIKREELMDGIDYGGAATYINDASKASVTLFI